MTEPTAQTPPRRATDLPLLLGLAAVVAFFAVGGFVAYWNTRTLNRNVERLAHTHEVLTALNEVRSLMKDAETGQRGFVITGDARYLEPHTLAVARVRDRVDAVERLTADNPEQQARVPPLRSLVNAKLVELDETIALRRTVGFEAAQKVVASDRGKAAMDGIREATGEMEREERDLRGKRFAEVEGAYAVAVGSGVVTTLVGVLLAACVAALLRRTAAARRREAWLQTGQLRLAVAMAGDQRVDQIGDNVLKFLTEYLGAHAGAFFVPEAGGYRRVAAYGVPAGGVPERLAEDDGLVGRAVKDRRAFVVADVPDGYIQVGSALGRASPRHLAIVPAATDTTVDAVFELGFLQPADGEAAELLDRASGVIGAAVRAARYRAHLQNALEEQQKLTEELQAQTEELRVANEELDEQSRALKESQTRLEEQHGELEATAARLEEHAQLLADQRDAATQARAALQVKARELEQASRYKSDFLANMSHELRTPLNSSLILAKLLADNRTGNLSGEQVRYAQTIYSAGNDLLALINDILDLSKIEAGKMDVRPEPVPLAKLADDLARVFEPVAGQKKLAFRARVAPDAPESVTTDRQRLEQVLKNLLSNALKFTEKGDVALEIGPAAGGRVAFAVRDTGIGIPEHQQEVIFEAFRQADGTTSRKYGGTGLGLSIARELVRLLGGELSVASEPGKGSTFTVTLPAAYDPAQVAPRLRGPLSPPPATASLTPAPASAEPRPPVRPAPVPAVEDDRARLAPGRRTILVVEDDAAFARILLDLAHELDFQCVVAHTAEAGLAAAAEHRPSAVVLDVGLPDLSGLSVLDRLKRDDRTRHIPVHVVSAHDYAQTALTLGAVGYMLKPVKREQLEEALQRLETKLDQRLRRVLIVEDDAVQLDSLRALLGTQDVETVGARTAAECLDRLRGATFDCMVLDLTLPDASGYSLLETLSREGVYSFPPVIVYTGRDLSADEEQRLRKYSQSIIIKGAKSPERLLDEVTLFLHQVVSELPAEQQRMLEKARSRDAALEGRRILVVEDDVRNVFALTSILEPCGAAVTIARNGREALAALEKASAPSGPGIDLVLMDVMMPEMDGLTATREIRKRDAWKRLPVIMLTAKAMRDDQEQCLAAGANDYMAKPLDVDKLLSLVRVWMPR
jgi:signal transduction histidine kinase/CheY-like chemotaxis protein/CHASE3 domain sensor protein